MILAFLYVWLDLHSLFANDMLAEGAGILVLLAAAVVLYRAFRERYLLVWIVGWSLYLFYREGLLLAGSSPEHRFILAFAQACFMLAVASFVVSALFYTNSRQYLLLTGLICAFSVDLAVIRALWFPHSLGFLIVLHVMYRAMTSIAAIRLALFSRGRRELGMWLLTGMMLLLHMDDTLHNSHSLVGIDSFVEVMLGLSMLFVALDDSRARNRRLSALTAIATAIAEAREQGSMMTTALTELKKLTRAQAAWFRLLENDRLTIQHQIGLSPEYAESRREILASDLEGWRLLRDRVTAHVRVTSLQGEARRLLEKSGYEHLVFVPVGGKNSVIGVITLALGNPKSYTQEELRFLTTTANGIGIAIENLQMFHQVVRSQRQWVSTFDSIEDLIFVHDPGGQVLRVNLAFGRKLACTASALVKKPISAVLPNAEDGCPYCARLLDSGVEGPDPCFGGYSLVSTSSYSEEGSVSVGTVHVITDTTDRRAAEQRYRLLFEEVQEGVFISTPEGRFLDCNQAFVKLLGYDSRTEVLGLDIGSQLYRNPEHRKAFLREMDSHGFVRQHEVIVKRKDGTSVTLLENSFATRDAHGRLERLQGFLVDITEKKRAEEEIRRRNRELHALNAIAVIGTQSFDLDEVLNVTLRQIVDLLVADTGTILIFEPHSRVLRRRAAWGYASDFGGASQSLEVTEEFWRELISKRTETFTEKHPLPEFVATFVESEALQSWIWVVMWSQDKPLGVVGVSSRVKRDFAATENLMVAVARQLATTIEKVRLYEETSRAYDDLRRTQEQLLQSEKMSAVGQLISGVAHELNNPLTAILGYSQLLEAEPLDERARDFVAKLYRQAQRTHRVVQNLLSFARQRKPVKQHVDLRRVVEDTLALRDYDLKLNNILIERDYEEVLPVYGDSHQLEQVFLNIINNAVDAMLEAARGGRLQVRIFAQQQQCCVEVRDSGPGIKELSRIFDPFYTTKKIGKGTGLGLSICYGILKEHGGDIVAFNHNEGGAVFQVKMPFAAERRKSSALLATTQQKTMIQGRVLLIEDEESILEFEREVLAGAGADVTAVSDGEKAIERLSAEEFDVIVSDAKLPGKWRAQELHEWLSQHRPGLEKRVIFTLAMGDDPELRAFFQLHHLTVLIKPFQVPDLLAVVRKLSTQSNAAKV